MSITAANEIYLELTAAPVRFRLRRDHDVSGVSGTGYIAEGVVWSSGELDLHWPGNRQPGVTSTTHYKSVADMLAVHGHDGATAVEWIDPPNPEWLP